MNTICALFVIGEIEARDTANRRHLTAKKRRQTLPRMADEHTVFEEENGERISHRELEQGERAWCDAVGSKVEKSLNEILTTKGNLPLYGEPNSTVVKYSKDGKMITKRQYDGQGRAKKDIDYTNHGNPARHPFVPHEHNWDWTDSENPIRLKWEKNK